MEHGAFEPPFGEETLIELGRATYNWAMADMIAEAILRELAKTTMVRDLIQPLMVEKKAQIIKRQLNEFPEGDCRDSADKFVRAVIKLNEGRNYAIHGFWGWHWSPEGNHYPVAYSHKAKEPLKASEIATLSDKMALATKQGHKALFMLIGREPALAFPYKMWIGKTPGPGERLPAPPQALRITDLGNRRLRQETP